MAHSTERQLLFGLLALQNGFITRDQLVGVFGVWIVDKSRSIDSVFAEQKAISADTRDLLAALTDRHLAQHDNDAARSLAALEPAGSTRHALAGLNDDDLSRSIVLVGASRGTGDPLETLI